MKLIDSLKNYIAELGTPRDKMAGSFYVGSTLTEQQAVTSYGADWLPRKIVDLPPWDATREWRAWQASKKQIERIEAEEKRLGVQQKVMEAMQAARLRGGCALLIGTGDRDPSKPLEPGRLGRGGLRYLTLIRKEAIQVGDIEDDITLPTYGQPRYFTVGQRAQNIHPSRLVIFRGALAPGNQDGQDGGDWWGASVLENVMTACLRADSTLANVASLVFEAKVDVFLVPDLLEDMSRPDRKKQLLDMARLNATHKGINGALLIDKEMEYQSKSANFSNLPDIIDRFLQVCAGAADIPVTRLLGQSPGGMNSTGEADLRNYYDHVRAVQTLRMAPLLPVLDECLIRSALGGRPADVFYTWRPLWQPTAEQASKIGKETADTIKTLADTRLLNPNALAAAAVNTLTERDVLPGLESATEALGLSDPGDDPNADGTGQGDGQRQRLQDAAPRPLYVSRKVLNADAILAWAEAQGIGDLLPADELHVTVTYSRDPVDWLRMGHAGDWTNETRDRLVIPEGGPRIVERLGNFIVLAFASSRLAWRHESMIENGASWDWSDYTPHVSLTKNADAVEPDTIQPYTGPIELGPEIFEELDP